MKYTNKTLFRNLINSLLLLIPINYLLPKVYPMVVLEDITRGILVLSTLIMIISYVVILGVGIVEKEDRNFGLYLCELLHYNPALIIQILLITIITGVVGCTSLLPIAILLGIQIYYLLVYYWDVYSTL